MSVTSIGSNLVHYEALGHGQPLIFVHGWLGSWRYWWQSMQTLSKGNKTFALDLWGFGDYSKVTSHYSLASYIKMLEQFVETLGIVRPFALVGHALGSAVALRYSTSHPDYISQLVLVSLPVSGAYINGQLRSMDSQGFPNRHLGKSNLHQEVAIEVHKTDRVAINVTARELMDHNFETELLEPPFPVLMISGGQDTIVSRPEVDLDDHRLKGGRTFEVTLSDCGHFPMLENPAVFNRLLQDFIHGEDHHDLSPKQYWRRRTR
jgi:pimeloyl-ACP methyl ester carboxylesterase